MNEFEEQKKKLFKKFSRYSTKTFRWLRCGCQNYYMKKKIFYSMKDPGMSGNKSLQKDIVITKLQKLQSVVTN